MIGKGLGYLLGVVFGIPLVIVIVNFLFLRGNSVTASQVESYIKNSNIIEVFIPDEVDENSKIYYPKLTRGNNTKIIYRPVFYSEAHQKYLMLVSFSGFDFSGAFNRDKSGTRNTEVYNGGYFLVRANQQQWHDASFGTKEKPMPIFGIEKIGRLSGKPRDINDIWQDKKRYDISDEINYLFVEQYLDHFLAKEDFKKLFG